jgi:hypothetical protein
MTPLRTTVLHSVPPKSGGKEVERPPKTAKNATMNCLISCKTSWSLGRCSRLVPLF